jgi:hypothetical protein
MSHSPSFCEDGSEFLDFFGHQHQSAPSPEVDVRHIDWAKGLTSELRTTRVSSLIQQPEPMMRIM